MNKILYIIVIFIGIVLVSSCSRIIEIYKPVNTKNISWQEIYDLKKLNPNYVAQGIEVYKNYIFFTVHNKENDSRLIVFKIENKNKLTHIFTAKFPKEATHVSDLSIYNNFLYAIDYASNNLYKIDIEKTLQERKLIIKKIYNTNIKRSGSIIVTKYNNFDVILISQFMLNDNISVYKLNEIDNKNKKPLFKIKSKYFIQGLYKYKNFIFISSNKYKNDPIFIIPEKELFKNKNIDTKFTFSVNGPGNMIEDIAIYNDYLLTSDEETNKIYITKNKLNILNKELK